jgi:hypothetical protein
MSDNTDDFPGFCDDELSPADKERLRALRIKGLQSIASILDLSRAANGVQERLDAIEERLDVLSDKGDAMRQTPLQAKPDPQPVAQPATVELPERELTREQINALIGEQLAVPYKIAMKVLRMKGRQLRKLMDAGTPIRTPNRKIEAASIRRHLGL